MFENNKSSDQKDIISKDNIGSFLNSDRVEKINSIEYIGTFDDEVLLNCSVSWVK